MKKIKDVLWIVFVLLIIVSFITLIIHGLYQKMEKASEVLERCKSKGWDGVKFKKGISTGLICSNVSQAEKDAIPDDTNGGIGE